MEDTLIRKSITKDNVTKNLEVKKANNGFIIKISKEWYDNNEFKYETNYWISKTNPFDKENKKVSNREPKTITEAIKDLKF
jgi:hypothetical protein